MTDLNSSLMSRSFTARRLAWAGANVGTVVAAVATLTIASAAALAAQEAPAPYAPRFHVATYAGAAIPTGSLSDSFDNSFLVGAQGTYALGSHLELLGDFDWTRPTTSLASSDAHADVYQADVGVEVGGTRGNTRRWAMRPFADFGVRIFGERCLAVEDQRDEWKFRLVQNRPAAGPIVVKGLVKTLEQAADPLGVSRRRVVVNQIVLSLKRLKAGKFAGKLLGQFVFGQRRKWFRIRPSADKVFFFDGPQAAVAG